MNHTVRRIILGSALCLSQYLDYKTTRMGIESGHFEEGNAVMRLVLKKCGWKGLLGLKAVVSIPPLVNGNPLIVGSLACLFTGLAANNYWLLSAARKQEACCVDESQHVSG
jgi:hypothetical protein